MRPIAIGAFYGGPMRILVCDDERHIARIIQVNLERLGHKVICAFDGREAVELLEQSAQPDQLAFDRAIIGTIMPFMDGLEVLRWIRMHEHTKNLRTALLVSSRQKQDEFVLNKYRPDKVIVKPFNPMDILI